MKKTRLRVFAIAILLLFAGGSVAVSKVFANQDTSIYLPILFRTDTCQNQIPNQPASSITMEADTLSQINQQRAANGNLAPVSMNNTLVQVARFHSIDMAVNNFFDHWGSDGESPWDRYAWMCEKFDRKGEIIAAGYTSASAVVTAWMNSSGHRAIILTAEYTLAGVGYTYLAGSYYQRYWTVDFGTPATGRDEPVHFSEPQDCTTETVETPEGFISATVCK